MHNEHINDAQTSTSAPKLVFKHQLIWST